MQPLAKRAKCIDIDVQPHVIHAFLIQSSGTFFSLKIAGGVDFCCILSLWRGNFFACEGEMAASWRVGSCRLRIEKGVQEWLIIVRARKRFRSCVYPAFERKWFEAACFFMVFTYSFRGLIARSWSTEAQGNIPAFFIPKTPKEKRTLGVFVDEGGDFGPADPHSSL